MSESPVLVERPPQAKKLVKKESLRDRVLSLKGGEAVVNEQILLNTMITHITEIIVTLGKGRRESAYQLALKIELARQNFLPLSVEHPIPVMYKGERVSIGYLDILVLGFFFVECKAVSKLSDKDILQTMAYSRDMGLLGVLVNFNQKLQKKNSILHFEILLIRGNSIITHHSG